MSEKILLVEDDYALAMGTEFALEAEGYEVLHGVDIKSSRELLSQKPDLILLDVMLPDGNGYDFCREIRMTNQDVPIIFLTAVGEEVNIVQGFSLGADDYVTKPYRLKELLSRISANLRRAKRNKTAKVAAEEITFGNHKFLVNEMRLISNGENVDCTPSELRLLRELILNAGQIISRSQLLTKVYDTQDNFVDDNTLSVYMKRLRDKLSEDAGYIETVRGLGYRFKKQQGIDNI